MRTLYSELLGTQQSVAWHFNLTDLYPSMDVASLNLSRPFSMEEISSALFAMDMNASPGPDGFGPSFYKQFWPAVGMMFFIYLNVSMTDLLSLMA
jgi:hypothetical protein